MHPQRRPVIAVEQVLHAAGIAPRETLFRVGAFRQGGVVGDHDGRRGQRLLELGRYEAAGGNVRCDSVLGAEGLALPGCLLDHRLIAL